MITRTNSASAIDVGNTSDTINFKGSGTRPTYNSNDLAMYSDIPAAQVNSDWNANSGVAEILNKPTIPTVNDATITITQGGVTKGSFTLNQSSGDTIALDAGGGGSVDIDNSTITKNSDDELQAVATINHNSAAGAVNPVYDWIGTLAEYQAQDIETNHPDWVCYITDDFSAQAYDAYSKGQSDNLFVTKGHQVIEFQAPTSANNYTWYRKYADGWVEQGGIIPTTSSVQDITLVLPTPMANTEYTWNLSFADYGGTTGISWLQGSIFHRTTTSFDVRQDDNVRKSWQVSGMAA
jgi:hypothetical protein